MLYLVVCRIGARTALSLMFRDLITYWMKSIPRGAPRRQRQVSATGWMKTMPIISGRMQCRVLQDESHARRNKRVGLSASLLGLVPEIILPVSFLRLVSDISLHQSHFSVPFLRPSFFLIIFSYQSRFSAVSQSNSSQDRFWHCFIIPSSAQLFMRLLYQPHLSVSFLKLSAFIAQSHFSDIYQSLLS